MALTRRDAVTTFKTMKVLLKLIVVAADETGTRWTRRIAALLGAFVVLALGAPGWAAEEAPDGEVRAQEEGEDASDAPVADPVVIWAPSGRLLPSGGLYGRGSVDTSGSFLGEGRIGLGGFAEFGFTSTPYVRFEQPGRDSAEFFDGYPFLLGRVGLPEGLLWSWQPDIALGLRKSFKITQFERETQASEITLALTEPFGPVSATLGLALWDAEIAYEERGEEGTWALDEEVGYDERIRPYVGLEVRVLDDYRLMAEYYYMPEFEYARAQDTPNIELDAALSAALRAEFTSWLKLDVGARVPDFTNLHQIDGELFTQIIVPLRLW